MFVVGVCVHNSHRVEDAGRMSEWIDVDDRVPDPWQLALCVFDGENIHCRGAYDYQGHRWYQSVVGCDGGELERRPTKVTHWMMWPEPPYE